MLAKIELLWTKDGSWASDSNPTNESFGRNLELTHGPETNEGTGSSKTCLAVDGDGFALRVLPVVVDDIEEALYDVIWRGRSIDKE